MTLSVDDIRAAVTTGTISEAQAAQILALSDARRGHRENLTGVDEPFELFKGFNEVFIVVGLAILYTGWTGIVGISSAQGPSGFLTGAILCLVSMGVSFGLAVYFTLKRRMIAPSIAISIMFGASAAWAGLLFGNMLYPKDGFLSEPETILVAAGFATVSLLGFWWWFRVPFAMFLIALGVFATCFNLTVVSGAEFISVRQVFMLSAHGPFSVLTIGLGILGFCIALAFDMSDPHRVTRRSAQGFWLHIIAAPAIVNTVALTLFNEGSTGAMILLMVFLFLIAVLAVVIDRRSFLVSGVGYVVALAFTVTEEGAFAAILILGACLVLLGAFWERIRASIMGVLPNFPGKSRLPPWQPPSAEA